MLLGCSTLGVLACPEPEAEAVLETPRLVCDAEGNLVQKAGILLPGCGFLAAYGPNDERRHRCTFRGERPVCGLSWSPDDPTPAGPYACTCNVPSSRDAVLLPYSVNIPDASDCEAALDAACEVDRQAPAPCSIDYTGKCWPAENEPGRWTCQCEGSDEVHDVRNEVCTTAAFLTCTAACSDASGSCEPDRENIGYQCQCPDGEQVYWPGARACNNRLARCRPTAACQTSFGRCALRPGGFGCYCPNLAAGEPGSRGNPILVSEADAYGNCQVARELACGFPAAGSSCSEEEFVGRTETCTADGRGGWDCLCSTGLTPHVSTWLEPRPDLPPEIATRVFTCEEALTWCG